MDASAWLDNLIGRWDLTGRMGQTPLEQDVTGRWVLGGLFVQLHFKSRLPGTDGRPPYEALYHIGHNVQEDVYVLHLLDTFGVTTSCQVGVGKREGNAVPFVFDYGTGPFTNRFAWDAGTQAWTFEQSYVQNGAIHTFATKCMVRSDQP